MAYGKFYKVDSLAVATRILHNYQVLLDDGNRIIIPQGNFKFYFCILMGVLKMSSSVTGSKIMPGFPVCHVPHIAIFF